MEDKFFYELRKKIQPHFEEKGSHDFNHTERVYNLAIMISKDEKVDMDIVRAATTPNQREPYLSATKPQRTPNNAEENAIAV